MLPITQGLGCLLERFWPFKRSNGSYFSLGLAKGEIKHFFLYASWSS